MPEFDPFDEENYDENLRRVTRELFKDPPPPRDTVPGAGVTLADILAADALMANDAAGVVGAVPGEVILDEDGSPVGVAPSTPTVGEFGGRVITPADVERLGIDPADHPSILAVWDPATGVTEHVQHNHE